MIMKKEPDERVAATSTEIGGVAKKPTTTVGPTTPPSVGTSGSTWIDSSSGTVHVSDGSKWMPVGGMTGSTVTSPTFASGGVITGTSVTTTPLTWSPAPAPAMKKPPAIIDAPTRRPKKLLIAFLGDDDDVEWCAKVNPDDIDVSFDKDEPAPRVELGFWLIDAG